MEGECAIWERNFNTGFVKGFLDGGNDGVLRLPDNERADKSRAVAAHTRGAL